MSRIAGECRFDDNSRLLLIEREPESHADKCEYWTLEKYYPNRELDFAWIRYYKEGAVRDFKEMTKNRKIKYILLR